MDSQSWITRHWPHPRQDDLAWNIYLKKEELAKADAVERGDRVLFYETRAPKVERGKKGYARRIRDNTLIELIEGACAIVRIGTVTAKVRARTEIPYDYGVGDPYEWKYEVECRCGYVKVPVLHCRVKEVLGFTMFFAGSFRRLKQDPYEQLARLCAR